MPPATETSSDGISGDQPVAHGEHRVGARRLAQFDALLQGSNQQPGDDVDRGNQDGGQRVALVEPRRSVHGPVELGLARDRLPAAPRLGLVDQARHSCRHRWPSACLAEHPE